jgi:hypothetical protein
MFYIYAFSLSLNKTMLARYRSSLVGLLGYFFIRLFDKAQADGPLALKLLNPPRQAG